jgi:hypothetical protein
MGPEDIYTVTEYMGLAVGYVFIKGEKGVEDLVFHSINISLYPLVGKLIKDTVSIRLNSSGLCSGAKWLI